MPGSSRAHKQRKRGAVGKKISKLVHEGKSQKQAVATALSMKRAGRLTKEGGYKRVKRKKGR
jgi:hypothetical protein